MDKGVANFSGSLKTELKEKSLTVEKLLSLDEAQKAKAYRELSKALGHKRHGEAGGCPRLCAVYD